MRTTRTFALLEVSPALYAEVRAKLEAAEYDHAFHHVDGRDVIDMNGIALAEDKPAVAEKDDQSAGRPAQETREEEG